jgi:hypothetical protein
LSISTYSELQDAVANWLDRDDLDARIPEFISLAEARMGRELRKLVTVSSLTIDAGEQVTPLPDDVAELRSVRHNNAEYKAHLTITTPYGLDQYRELGSGVPVACAVINNNLLLNVEPASSYDMEIIYFTELTPLSSTNTTNDELAAAPDLYLFGALCEAAPFLEHDARVPLWEAKYQAALRGVNAARESAELGAGPTTMALPVVFG